MIEDFERRYRAVQSKDARFDGWFFTAVTSTGIYCRPSCPAMTPRPGNVRFYPTAAAAQGAGFRACKRCRPDAAPGSPEWDGRADVVARAMRLIADGIVDRGGVPGLAAALGYSTRQLERLLAAELGAGPIALARAQRAQTARVLIESTDLRMADVAFAAGFASVRQFNDTVRAVFAVAPTELRDRARRRDKSAVVRASGAGRVSSTEATPIGSSQLVVLRLPRRQPFTADHLFGHLAATAVPGVEEVSGGWYRRTLRLPNGSGIVGLRSEADHVACRLRLSDVRDLGAAVARCRRLLDLDADPEAVDAMLSTDPGLEALVRKAPGLRVPRSVDEGEMALRVVFGQQVSTASARAQTGALVARHGTLVDDPDGGLTLLFPEAATVAAGLAEPEAFRGPARRRATLAQMAGALAEGRLDLGPGCDRDEARAVLSAMPGIGLWSVEMIAMRALGDPDAFPAGDLGLRRAAAAAGMDSESGNAAALIAHAESWRPWRAYAVQYLWSTLDHPINRAYDDSQNQEEVA